MVTVGRNSQYRLAIWPSPRRFPLKLRQRLRFACGAVGVDIDLSIASSNINRAIDILFVTVIIDGTTTDLV